MAASWTGKLSSNRERAARELVQGQEFATHLQFLLKKHYRDDELLSADELVVKIVRSFTEALSLVTCYDFVENFQNQTTSQVDSVCCDDRKSEDSGESKKRATAKERRGCYKRKKISQSWTTVSATTEDGYAWRKYGQKQILNTKYPRSYFRCTHKYDQGCKATKQVQIMEEDPQMYGTTYIGHHTCRDIHKVPQIITPPDSSPGHESYMLTYSNSNNTPTQLDYQHHPFTWCPSTMIKQEYKEETPSDLTDELSSLDSMWNDLVVFEPADLYRAVASTACTKTASQSLDMDFAVSSVEFNGDFHFDESEFNYLSK